MILDLFRRTQSWFTKAILLLLALAFVFGFGFSISNFRASAPGSASAAAEINGEEVALTDFYRLRDALLRSYRKAGIPEESINPDVVGVQALNQLINVKLLAQEARRLGLRVSDEELREAIVGSDAFRINGKFVGSEAYRQFVEKGLNERVSEFERKYREELLAQKMVDLINDSVVLSDEELRNIYRIRNEKVALYYLRFSPEQEGASYVPDEDEVRGYYEKHLAEFKTPERRVIRYFTVPAYSIAEKMDVSEEELRAYYELHRDEFSSGDAAGDKRFEAHKDAVKAAVAKERLKGFLPQFAERLKGLLKTRSLEEVAREGGGGEIRSTHPVSRDKAPPDGLPPAVVSRAFELGAGGKDVVAQGDTIWVFEVGSVLPAGAKPLGEVRDEIVAELKRQRGARLAEQKAERALRMAKSGKGLDEIAAVLGVEKEETAYFSRISYVPGIDSEQLRIDA